MERGRIPSTFFLNLQNARYAVALVRLRLKSQQFNAHFVRAPVSTLIVELPAMFVKVRGVFTTEGLKKNVPIVTAQVTGRVRIFTVAFVEVGELYIKENDA